MKTQLNFANDYLQGAHPNILKRMMETNQVEMTGFDWQIPGLREELVIALIKSLPKSYRRNFVPAPNYAQAFLSRAVPLEKPLLDTLIYELRRMTGVTVEAEHWNWEQIPSHLKMTFRVVDENGKKIAESMNLDELKFNLKGSCTGKHFCRGG